MTTAYRLSLIVASITAALALSACQPKPEDTEPTPTEEIMLPAESMETPDANDIEPDVEEDAAEPEEPAAEPEMTDMLKDYTRAMTRMNDEMMIGMGYNDPDTAFAKSMLGHHRGAIDMAKIQLKYGTDSDMRKLAQDIIDGQQLEVNTLRKWLASNLDAPDAQPNTETVQQAYADDVESMREDMSAGITELVADVAFAQSMLALHKGAVDMALIQLKYGTNQEMRDLALQIIGKQQIQVLLMENWLATYQSTLYNLNPSAARADQDASLDGADNATNKAASESEPFSSEIIENQNKPVS